MNSKAIKRQLLAAIAMVLVAALALGSSTYAWFVASGTVKAEGMKVQAQSEGGLVIRYHGGKWGTSATAGVTEAKELKPASSVDLTTWYTAEAMDPDDELANLATVTPLSLGYAAGKDDTDNESACYNNSYALVKYFEIRSATDEKAPKGLKIDSITVNYSESGNVNFTKNMSTALRVGVQCLYRTSASEQTYITVNHIYAPVNDNVDNIPSTTYHYIESYAGAEGTAYRYSDDTTKGGVSTAKFTVNNAGDSIVPDSVVLSNDPVKVYIFVWYEGEDQNLYSSNFNTEAINVAVNFTSIATVSA